MRFAKDGGYPHECTCNRTHFKHICSLPLVHRPKGVLLVIIGQYLTRLREANDLFSPINSFPKFVHNI